MSPASAASSVAAAARLLASRWKPSNRSRLSPSEPEYDVFEGTVTICPVAALYRLVDARVDEPLAVIAGKNAPAPTSARDRKSTRLNSSHVAISYAVFCLKKKNTNATGRKTTGLQDERR